MVLRCINCGKTYPEDEIRYRCDCGCLLEVVIDLDNVETGIFDGKNVRLWKYESWLPVKKRVSLDEGGTPLYKLENLGKELGAKELYVKNKKVPDNVILPVGNAGNISAIWKGFKELYAAGVIDELPRMIGIQGEGLRPLPGRGKRVGSSSLRKSRKP